MIPAAPVLKEEIAIHTIAKAVILLNITLSKDTI